MRMQWLVLAICLLWTTAAIASPHPGNIFLLGDDVHVSVPKTWSGWTAFDVDHKQIASSAASDPDVDLGKLPIGYFELRQKDGGGRVTAAVLPRITATENTPIAIDAAMCWFYRKPEEIRDACALCRMAGVNWVRDRGGWPELQPSRGKWAGETRYERTMRLEHEEGLRILQVNHISPPWATKNATHFPDDLRDVYDFYRGLAARWKGLADAIEPWNEPDIIEFGGHTGCEIASFEKAASLGLKAGNSSLTTNDTVFAIDRAETLDEFGANNVCPYFDRYDMHIYIRMNEYDRAFGRHRAVCGGRPIWTTEFNLPVHWADEKTKEPSDDELLVQGYRVGKVFSHALYQGAEKAFYFMLEDYVERNIQYGLVHKDMTPRPAYVAFATVGRLLNGAVPIGRVDLGNDKLFAYAFATQVDGSPKETLVMWAETKTTEVKIPPAEKAFDCFGRELPDTNKAKLTRATVFMLLPPGGSKSLKIQPPPSKPAWQQGKTCPIVLQLLGPTDFKQSAFILNGDKSLHLVAYNFGDKPEKGKFASSGVSGASDEIEIASGAKSERAVTIDQPGKITIRLDLGDAGSSIVAANVVLGSKE